MGRPSKLTEAIGIIYWWVRLPNESRMAFESRRRSVLVKHPYAIRYVMQSN